MIEIRFIERAGDEDNVLGIALMEQVPAVGESVVTAEEGKERYRKVLGVYWQPALSGTRPASASPQRATIVLGEVRGT